MMRGLNGQVDSHRLGMVASLALANRPGKTQSASRPKFGCAQRHERHPPPNANTHISVIFIWPIGAIDPPCVILWQSFYQMA